jgi:hypothetical protein
MARSLIALSGTVAVSTVTNPVLSRPECAAFRAKISSVWKPASVREESAPRFGGQAREVIKSYPVGAERTTSRQLLYSSRGYVGLIWMNGSAVRDVPFDDFARQVSAHVRDALG